MQIQVNVNNLSLIQSDELNENEYNIHNIQFIFSNEYTENLAKVALFTANDTTYKVIITNNKCIIPPEILANQGCFTLGVYAFEVQEEELIERYSPSPIKLYIEDGSYIPDKNTENSEPITPTDKEQILSLLAEIQEEYNEAIQEINTAIQETNNLNINVSKEGKVTTVVLTKKNGTTKTVEIDDGVSLQFMWQGTSLGIKREDEENYIFVDLKGATGATPNIQIGTVVSGSTPSVTISGTPENPILNFTLVKGDTGPQGETGPTGNGIASINKTGTSGLVDTYTITYTDGTTTTFTVTNGQDGEVTQAQFDELQQQVEDLENNQLQGTATGTAINITDSASANNRSIGITGNATQDGTPTPENPIPINNTGDDGYINEKIQNKNEFDKNNITILNQYITTGGVITASSGTNAEKSFVFPCKPNTTYTISKLQTYRFRIGESTSNFVVGNTYNVLINDSTSSNIKSTFTTGNNIKNIFVFFRNNTGETYTQQQVLNSIQIEERFNCNAICRTQGTTN